MTKGEVGKEPFTKVGQGPMKPQEWWDSGSCTRCEWPGEGQSCHLAVGEGLRTGTELLVEDTAETWRQEVGGRES